jgi:hypothetical protein
LSLAAIQPGVALYSEAMCRTSKQIFTLAHDGHKHLHSSVMNQHNKYQDAQEFGYELVLRLDKKK